MIKKLLYEICNWLVSFSINYKYNLLKKSGRLIIGEGTYGVPDIHEYKGSEANIIIGRYSCIGPNVTLITGGIHKINVVAQYPIRVMYNLPNAFKDGHPYTKGDIVIGSDVWIGSGVTILSGVTIGDGAIIAANATVTKSIPAYAIATGIPAKVISMRFSDDIIAQLLNIRWWDWPKSKIAENVVLLNDTNDISNFIEKHKSN
jgi:acetyltransferase-like isoleucine patch superfamily enzyme